MFELLNNPWFVGIGGGILSGLLVAFITRAIFSRRDNREYFQKLNLANSEVLYAIRPGVSEGVIPHKHVVDSLIEATARKYSVDPKDMYDSSDMAGELIKEVMDSSFLSASAKSEFCDKLTPFKSPSLGQPLEAVARFREFEAMSKYRKQTVAIIGMMTAVLTGLMGVMLEFIHFDNAEPDGKFALLIMPALIAVLAVTVARIYKDVVFHSRDLKKMQGDFVFRDKIDGKSEQGISVKSD